MLKRKKVQKQPEVKQHYKSNQPCFLQNIYRQLHNRRYNLDYLQWLQHTSSRYTAGICIIALMISVTALWHKSNWEGDEKNFPTIQQVDLETFNEKEMDVVRQHVYTVPMDSVNADVVSEQMIQQKSIINEDVVETKVQYLDPLFLSGYQAPCNSILLYEYGFGYDPIYGDYRYHRELCYKKEDGDVYACVDGTVIALDLDQHWQLAIQSSEAIVWYSGLADCSKIWGDVVTAGELIGTAEVDILIQSIKNERE